MPDPMSLAEATEKLRRQQQASCMTEELFYGFLGRTSFPELLVKWDEQRIEVDRLRSQLADRDAQVTRMCGELATAQSPPSAKETQDAFDELTSFVSHAATCELANPTPTAPLCQPICDCGACECEDKLEALILRLATGNAERLAAAEGVCHSLAAALPERFEDMRSGMITAHMEAAVAALERWQALREGGDDD